MRPQLKRNGLLAVLIACLFLLRGDVSADEATCCNLATAYTSSIFPGGDGDEGFFGLPIGVPTNVMILLDNSGSMTELPLRLPAVTLGYHNGTCSGTYLDDGTARRTTTPYDNGTSNTFITDSPPWSTANCNNGNGCLFRADRYYKYQDWGTNYATQYQSGSTAGKICNGMNDTTGCQTCLDDVGYYLYGTWGGGVSALFKGDFLNGTPPKFVIARKVVKDLVAIDSSNPTESSSIRFGLTIFTNGNNDSRQNGLDADDGGVLVVPLGPNCDRAQAGFSASDPTQSAAYKEARQTLVDAINNPSLVAFGTWTPLGETLFNIGEYFSDTRGNGGATTGVDGPEYDYMFGTQWTRANFYESSAGTASAPWVSTGRQKSICWSCQQSSVVIVTDGEPTHDANIARYGNVTGHPTGPTPGTDTTNKNNDFRNWNLSDLKIQGCPLDGGGNDPCASYILQKVAYFLSHTDLRRDLSNVKQSQTVATYTISFGIEEGSDDASTRAVALLQKTASLGGGKFFDTSSGDELAAALHTSVGDTIARATSFSVSNTNTLQTGNNNQLLLARFRKEISPVWEGHLFRFKVFNEYVQGCDATKTTAQQTSAKCTKGDGSEVDLNPNLNQDTDCNGKALCDGLFILDSNCDAVAEDKNGDFRKARLVGGKFVADTTDAPAVPYWDAGAALSYKKFPADYPIASLADKPNTAFRSADANAKDCLTTAPAAGDTCRRMIYTVVDSNHDGKFTAADDRIEFIPANADLISPYLDLNGKLNLGTAKYPLYVNVCANLLQRAGLCDSDATTGLPACPAVDASFKVDAASIRLCAIQVINWVRGWDVMDEDNDGCGGPGNPSNAANCEGRTQAADGSWSGGSDGEERIRGTYTETDNAGNTTVVPNDNRQVSQLPEFWKLGDIFHSSPVLAKPPATEFICDLGLDQQCVATIHSPQGFPATQQTPNDWDVNGDGTIGAGETAYAAWRQAKAQRPQIALVGANDGMLHAFDAGVVDTSKPADWLGTYSFKPGTGTEMWAFIPPDVLPKLKLAMTDHQYFVDGNTMVRDAWIDVSPADGKREPTEFRTMAVLSERSGGNRYLALDISDTLDPKFRWTFPDNCTMQQNLMGQTWSGFAPRPPPIGPVKLAVTNAALDPTSRGFEERWVAMLNGGYDPTLTRGRGVWMVDVWTGQPLWKFTDDDLKTNVNSSANMWSVPAAVGMLDVGDSDQATLDADGYFDTANWGDMGGSLFVARMKEPGVFDPATGLVKNWWAGRVFEEQRQANDAQLFQDRSEFFQMSGNSVDLRTGYVHSFLGGGNRESLLQTAAECGPGNVLGCCQSGCNVEMYTHYSYSSCNVVNHIKCTNGKMVQDMTNTSGSCGDGYTCDKLNADVQMKLQCGAAGNPADIIAKLTCDADGNCTDRQQVGHTKPVDATKLPFPTHVNRFYGIWSYGGNARSFSTKAGAQTFDANRFTDIPYAGTCAGASSCSLVDTTQAVVSAAGAVTCADGSAKCSAGRYDPGWFYTYGQLCPSGTCDDPLPWKDEKTASGATVILGCVDWNTFRPRGSSGSTATDPCASSDMSQARNYTYLSDSIMGVPQPGCGFNYAAGGSCTAQTGYVRASPRQTIAPPPDPTQMVSLGMDGEVKVQAVQIEPGGTPTTSAISKQRELVQPAYWLEVSPELHVCRHVNASTCK